MIRSLPGWDHQEGELGGIYQGNILMPGERENFRRRRTRS